MLERGSLGRKLVGAGLAASGITAAGIAVGTVGAVLGYRALRRARLNRRYDLAGRTVLITGGSRGLGYAIAREFLRHGARVALVARDTEELERARQKLAVHGEVMTVPADLRRPEAPRDAVTVVREAWGSIEVLVHNAGVIQLGPWERMGEAEFQEAMDIHFWAALRLDQAVLPEMIARRQGRVVHIASIGGVVAVPHMLPYTASKFALVGLSQGLASEVRRHGVYVSCVCPFLTRTGSQERAVIRGARENEFAWFAASGSMPGFTQSAAAAARRVVRACQSGEAHVVLSFPGKLAAWAHGLAPGATVAALGVANRWLPAADGAPSSRAETFNDRWLRPRVQDQGEDLNQSRS